MQTKGRGAYWWTHRPRIPAGILARLRLRATRHVRPKPLSSHSGARLQAESPESITTGQGVWIPGLASASLRRPGMTCLIKVDTLAPRALTQRRPDYQRGLILACACGENRRRPNRSTSRLLWWLA